MAPVKGKPAFRIGKNVEGCGPSKRVLTSKLKIFSENEKPSASGREAVVSKGSKPVLQKTMKKDEKDSSSKCLASECEGGKDGAHAQARRKALADLSNVSRSTFSISKMDPAPKLRRNEVGTYSRNSWVLRKRNSSASFRQSLVEKKTSSAPQGIVSSHVSGKVKDNVSTKINSTFQKQKVQVCTDVKNSNQVVRRSFPVSGKDSCGDRSGAKENSGSTNVDKRTYGFRVKTRIAGTMIPRASDARDKPLKDRVSDGFLVMGSRAQTDLDAHKRFQKSVKPMVKGGLTASKAGRHPSSKRISHLDKLQAATSSEIELKVIPCLPKSTESAAPHEAAAEELEIKGGKDLNLSPMISDASARRKADRRKSYTSMLISGSKLLEDSAVKNWERLQSIDDYANPLEVAEYVDEIYLYYWAMEAQSTSLVNYMVNQPEITPQMRGVLVNWLIEVHNRFDLMPETLYLTVALLDRYLSVVTISKSEMQLVGLTALLLASKYEDFWHPRVNDLVSISAESYTTKQMLEMEKNILGKLMFRFNLPTAYVFMLRFLKASQSDSKQLEHLAFYLIELSLVEYEALSFKSSMLCAAAIYLARCTLQITPGWTPLLVRHARYRESQIKDCAEMILRFQKAAKGGLLKVTYEKYRRPELGEVSTIKPLGYLPC